MCRPRRPYSVYCSALSNIYCMSRILSSSHFKTTLLSILIIGGALIYALHAHYALAADGTYGWLEIFPASGVDSEENLVDTFAPCSNFSRGPLTCNASTVGAIHSTGTCTGNGFGDTAFYYEHDFVCNYTPPPAATCAPDTSGAANTCTTSTYTATNADCSTSQLPGTKDCTVPTYTCTGLGYTDGTYPNCFSTCDHLTPAEVGTWPNCSTPPPPPPPPTCDQFNQIGTYPNCTTPPPPPAPPAPAPATASLIASPARVTSGQGSRLTATGSNLTGSCTVSGPGVNQVLPVSNGSFVPNPSTITTPPITGQSVFTLTCADTAASTKVIVNVNPVFTPF